MIDLKSLINPVILFFLIILIGFIIGINDFLMFFIIFFVISFFNNIVLILRKKVKSGFYLFLYIELFFSLIFILPFFIIIGVQRPIVTGVFILGLTDFIIQLIFDLFSLNDGKELIEFWKDKLLKSEREIFHPISLRRYIFKDFVLNLTDLTKKNLTRNYVLHNKFLVFNLSRYLIRQQYGNNNSFVFFLLLKFKVKQKNEIYNGVLRNKEILDFIRENRKIASNVITAYLHYNSALKIVIKKDFVLNNPEKIYNFLKKLKLKFEVK